MPNIDDIIERLLGDRRIREGAAFTTRTFSDQPLIERGSDFKQRIANREQNRAAREARQGDRERRIEQREEARAARRRQQEFIRQQERKTAQEQRSSETRPDPAFAPQPIGQQTASSDAGPSRAPSWSQRLFSLAPELESIAGVGHANKVPERIREMRKLERGGVPNRLAYGSTASASLFYRQARLMEDYEDAYEFAGTFSQYYPTYASMSDHQLRGYFSWRTQVRAGNVQRAPLSFAYVYLYELLCGIGTIPGEQGLEDLRSFGAAWRDVAPEGASISSYLNNWIHDYVVYHGLADQYHSHGFDLAKQVLVLLRAEHAQLARDGQNPKVPNTHAEGPAPSPTELFHALGETATYHLGDSRLSKAEPELMARVASDVFAALVTHCARRRKTDFVEGLFGYATSTPYAMFPAAIFYEEQRHPDATVLIDDYEEFVCTGGRWQRRLPTEATFRNKELGSILHQVDFELRKQLDYAFPLKEKKVPKYVEKIVREAVAARLEERAEAERRRITIDRSKLRGIRAAAAVTQEALLTDDERTEEPMPAPAMPELSLAETTLAPDPSSTASAGGIEPAAVRPPKPQPAGAAQAGPNAPEGSSQAAAPAANSAQPAAPATEGPLDPTELRLVQGLLAGRPSSELLGPGDPFVSVVADSINEKLFDFVGDSVIEFDGDEPCLIEDYLDDIREVLNL